MKKHITNKLFAALIGATMLMVSCKNDTEVLKLTPGTAESFKNLRQKALDNITQKKTFKAEDGIIFESKKGAKVTINSNCLRDANNNTVTGDVEMSFIEIYDRGNMVATNKPVMGIDGSGKLLPLVTGGQYNIQIKKGNENLKSGCIFQVSIPAKNTGELDEQMKLWDGIINDEGDLVWEEVGREAGEKVNLDPNKETATYNIWGNSFGWTNVDRFYNDSRPKTQIKVKVPTGYGKHNAGVYLAYEGEPNVLAQLDTYDTVEQYFSEHYGFIPVGMNVKVIFVSESNGSVVYAIKPVTIVNNATIQISENELGTSSLDNVINMINNLN